VLPAPTPIPKIHITEVDGKVHKFAFCFAGFLKIFHSSLHLDENLAIVFTLPLIHCYTNTDFNSFNVNLCGSVSNCD